MYTKKDRILYIAKEMDKTDTLDYEINGVPKSNVVFFWREPQQLYKEIPKGSYTVVEESGNQILRITNEEEFKNIERIQVVLVISDTSAKYEPEFKVDTTILKDSYNTLVDNFKSLFEYVRKTLMIADGLDVDVVLPQLNTDEVWVKTDNGYRGLNIGSLEQNIQNFLKEFEQLTEQALKDLTETKNKYIEEISGAFDEEITKGKQDITNHTNTKTEEATESITEHTNEELKRIEVTGINNKLTKTDTIEDIKKLFLKIDEIVEVLGYYSKDDGATHKRVISNTDDGSGVQLENGLWANIVHNGEVNISWFGAKGDSITDNSDIFQKCIEYCQKKVATIRMPRGDFLVSKPLKLNKDYNIFFSIIGENPMKAVLRSNVQGYLFDFDFTEDKSTLKQICIENLTIIGNLQTGNKLFKLYYCVRFYVSNCVFRKFTQYINAEHSWEMNFKRCRFSEYQDINSQERPINLGAQTNVWLFESCTFSFTGKEVSKRYYISIDGGQSNININNCVFEYGGGITIPKTNGDITNIQIHSCYFEWLEKSAIEFANGVKAISIKDCYLNALDSSNNKFAINPRENNEYEISNCYATRFKTAMIRTSIANNYNSISNIKCCSTDGIPLVTNATSIQYSSVEKPSTGQHKSGEIVWNISPKSSNLIAGWVCINGGEPGEWAGIKLSTSLTDLNNPVMMYAMEQEGGTVKQDYLNYSLEKMVYNKQVQEEEQAKQEAYQLALEQNPNLTYEEFENLQSQVMTMDLKPKLQEPQIPKSVQDFISKYL